MGCWNETCVLSRTPIGYGAPVVALTTVMGPKFRQSNGGGSRTDLLFGLPLYGKYDDYGGVDNYERPELKDFADKAFVACGLYRSHSTKGKHGFGAHHWVANGPDILWGLEHSLRHVFYARLGVAPSEIDSYDEAVRAKSTKAFTDCQAALVALGNALANCTLPDGEGEFQDMVFGEISKAFGPDAAWAAWAYLNKNGLYARQSVLMMHRAAYDAVVTEFSKRKVYKYGSKEKRTVRDFLKEQLESWPAAYETEMQRAKRLFGDPNDPESMKDVHRMAVIRGSYGYLKPLTSPWEAPEAPIVGHFWGGASVAEVMAAHDFEQVLDFMVFQWARTYLRIDLTPPSGGSQNEETKLHKAVMQAAYRTLRESRGLKEDFYGCLHN